MEPIVILPREIENLKKLTLSLGALVEESLRDAVRAFRDRDARVAQRVIDADVEIDSREVEVEEECLKILALHQPVAIDLRYIVAVIKLDNDLERIGDLAVDLAERAVYLSGRDPLELPRGLLSMADAVQDMVRRALDSLVNLDVAEARGVCKQDDEIDELHRQNFDFVEREIAQQPARVSDLIQLLSVSRYLERVADHATNIAEDVIYLVEGHVVRHRDEGMPPA